VKRNAEGGGSYREEEKRDSEDGKSLAGDARGDAYVRGEERNSA